jgi:hypothetical protein
LRTLSPVCRESSSMVMTCSGVVIAAHHDIRYRAAITRYGKCRNAIREKA